MSTLNDEAILELAQKDPHRLLKFIHSLAEELDTVRAQRIILSESLRSATLALWGASDAFRVAGIPDFEGGCKGLAKRFQERWEEIEKRPLVETR
jgi:hypothetical protein